VVQKCLIKKRIGVPIAPQLDYNRFDRKNNLEKKEENNLFCFYLLLFFQNINVALQIFLDFQLCSQKRKLLHEATAKLPPVKSATT